MPVRKQRTVAVAASPATPVKTPLASPAKASSSSPSRESASPTHNSDDLRARAHPHSGKDRHRSRSTGEASATPRRRPDQPRSRSHDGEASPSVPPAPATTPVPLSDRTPRRERSRSGSNNSSTAVHGSSKSTVLSVSASPAQPPPPPSSPVPVASRGSTSQTPSDKKTRPASVQGGSLANPTQPTAASALPKATPKPLSRNVRRQRSRHGTRDASSSSSLPTAAYAVERVIRESKVIAPDVSGLRCLAIHPSEQQVVVARENGSLVLFDVSTFQNIPQFVQRRHTGGQTRRTITSLAYVAVPAPTNATLSSFSTSLLPPPPTTSTHYVLLASMMSGQVVVYDAELLVPLSVHQRSGGAVWQLTAVSPGCVYTAMADGSWQQLRLTCRRDGASPQLELVRVVPGISGADRALTVATSSSLHMAVGSDDAGNVHAWRLPGDGAANDSDDNDADAAGHRRGLAEHESLWTTKLAKGIALSCAVVGGTQRPCAVVGTSMGDVVLLDAAHGHVFQTFSQHKGPVTTLAVQEDAVVYASGWHESLRSYRCSGDGDWHPAEVKRRTHYHEASQLALLPRHRLLLSASRDGTIMYAATAQLFHTPAMYVTVTTQQFAYAVDREVLLQSRFDTIEAFSMDSAGRHWVPFFGHRLDGRFHLAGLWCDARLDYVVFSTEERVGLLRVVWRAQSAMSIARIEEVLELPARTGAVDVCWGESTSVHRPTKNTDRNEEASAASIATATTVTGEAPRVLYVLYDDAVTSVTLADGYPAVSTAVQVRGKGLPADSLRLYRVFCRAVTESAVATAGASRELVLYGHRGSCRMQLMADGTPDADTLVSDLDDVYEFVREVPALRKPTLHHGGNDDTGRCAKKTKGEAAEAGDAAATAVAAVVALPAVLVGLSATQQHYLVGSTLHTSAACTTSLPATLPHDVQWIARIPTSASLTSYRYLGYFSRGLLVASGDSWHMVRRMSVEAAFVVKGGTEVLVLERNLEKTLEALPLSWKVRRFGN